MSKRLALLFLPCLPVAELAAQTFAAAVASAPAAAVPSLPQPLASFGACRQGDSLFVYGGHVGRTHAHTRSNQVGALLRLDLDAPAPAWREIATDAPLQSPALLFHGGLVVRLGGMSARNDAGAAPDLWSTDAVVGFDPATGARQLLPPLPEPRSSHDAVLVGSRAIVAGGWRLAGRERSWLDTAWSLDLGDPQALWQPLPRPPFRLRALALAAVGNIVHALGGMDADGEPSAAVYALGLDGGDWQRLCDLPGDGFGVAAAVQDGQLFASGRDGELVRLRDGGWEVAARLTQPRFFHRLLPASSGQLLAIGGAADAHLASCEYVPTDAQRTHVQTWTIPWVHPARNRQGFTIRDDRLYVVGGNCGSKQHDFEPQHFVADCVAIDLRTMGAAAASPLPQPRQSAGVAATDAGLIVVGGFAHSSGGARAQGDIFRYDARADLWTAAGALPKPRTQAGLTEVDGALWLLGGIDYDPKQDEPFAFQRDVLRCSAGDAAFEPLPLQLPRPRRAFGCASQGQRIWLVGGMREDFEPVTEVDVLDVATGAWSAGAVPSLPRVSPFLVALGDRLVLAGGSRAETDGLVPAAAIEVLDADATAWLPVDLPLEPPVLAALPWRDRLLLVTRSQGLLHLTAVRLPARRRDV